MNGLLTIHGGVSFSGALIGSNAYNKGRLVLFRGPFDPQFLLTDPSTMDQIILSAEPTLGTVGVRKGVDQSDRIFAAGLICREVADFPTYYVYYKNLSDMLERNRISALTFLDTDAIAEFALREPIACIADGVDEKARADLVSDLEASAADNIWTVTSPPCKTVYDNKDSEGSIMIVDLGQRSGMLDFFRDRYSVSVIPPFTHMDEITEKNPSGLIISNGPGDFPSEDLVDWIRSLKKHYEDVPGFAIGMGAMALARSTGFSLEESSLPHRGSSIPVIGNNKISLTYQNHRLHPRFGEDIQIMERCSADGAVESAYDPSSETYFCMYDPLPDICGSWKDGPLGSFIDEIVGGEK